MENIKEQRVAISDEDLEKVAGGAGATEAYNRYTFQGKLREISENVPGYHSNKSTLDELLQAAKDAAFFNNDFETAKAKLLEVLRLAEQEHSLLKVWIGTDNALVYLANCGKITYSRRERS